MEHIPPPLLLVAVLSAGQLSTRRQSIARRTQSCPHGTTAVLGCEGTSPKELAHMCRGLLDDETLMHPDTGVDYFLNTLRGYFLKRS